jgi:glucosamine--fructose-6-phosphate aminotransferase (isomerizing)
MRGDQTREAVFAQPEWLASAATELRLPADARVVFTGCGTSFHAAQTGGVAVQALEAAQSPPDADLLVLVSHEGTTPTTIAAAEAFPGEKWLVTGARESALVTLCHEVVVCTPAVERSWCHTASYTCAVAALAALRGEDVSWLPGAAAEALAGERLPVSAHDRWLVAGSGAAWPTAQEAVLKLREGCFVAAEAHHTEQLLHGHLAAVDETVRALVYDGPRAADAVAALRELGCDTTLVATSHPVLDIVPVHLLVLDLAEERGVDPDRIHRDDERWQRARDAYR